ncbi:hypothetical protein GPECTOR_25g326 [Gonium pectorale]|uniref:Protein kinase domain-containing protein n=1 Tax=Gonium pectorale TaxID=33097 RepID=A0A150GFX9_GONPE|nr:hypothetical protein GPECTOR_25g326 [Gonium pectorale]|eukprot:KXZ48742.1 hypothetical protein GPECTOR_25g326 [Gonium pectorale]
MERTSVVISATIKNLALREVRVLQGLNHPAIVPLLDAFSTKSGRVYMVFPCLSHSAFQALDEHPQGLPPQQLKVLAWQILQGLSYLHGKQIVHRDLKPANILITDGGEAKLCDFGFARRVRCGVRQAERLSSYLVTRWYRPPEVLVGAEYGPSADVWSLGCTLAELATGEPLFGGSSSADQLWHIMRCFGGLPYDQHSRIAANPQLRKVLGAPLGGRSLRQRLPGCDPGLMRLLEACLQPDPGRRCTADELLQMPYFWAVPRLITGSPLELLYSKVVAAVVPPPPLPLANGPDQAVKAGRLRLGTELSGAATPRTPEQAPAGLMRMRGRGPGLSRPGGGAWLPGASA